jgi:hypothetical protein
MLKISSVQPSKKSWQNAILADTRTQLTQLLGEYSDSPHLLPTTERDFRDNMSQPSFDWPINLIAIIKNSINKLCNTPTLPEFSFELNGKAALQNLAILSKYEFDLHKALDANKNSPLNPGSEFRAPDNLSKAFSLHPLWQRMNLVLADGSKWPLVHISEDARQQDVLDALTFGSHKGASTKPDLL